MLAVTTTRRRTGGSEASCYDELKSFVAPPTEAQGLHASCDRDLALSKDELLERARDADVRGRSQMSKDDLVQALARSRSRSETATEPIAGIDDAQDRPSLRAPARVLHGRAERPREAAP